MKLHQNLHCVIIRTDTLVQHLLLLLLLHTHTHTHQCEQQREKRDRAKMRKRFWELGGSRMGNAMGIQQQQETKEDTDAAAADDDANGTASDYKANAGYAKHMKVCICAY
jgi:hypothetical protein